MAKYNLKASQVVELFRSYKNYQEKRKLGTRAQMWDFHWCPGSANYTIWAMLYNDYVGQDYNGQPWCAISSSDIIVLALMKYCNMNQADAVTAAKDLYGGDLVYNCQLFINQHKGDRRLNHTPKFGSAVIFYTGSKYGHFGVVTGVDSNGKGFTSVEGNTSGGADKVIPDGGAICEKWHSLSSLTYFWHFDYADEKVNTSLMVHPISVGKAGLTITTPSLNIRATPANGSISGSYKNGDVISPFEKTFSDGKAWYHTDKGWISASYVQGWVTEDNGRQWYVMPGYSFTVNGWQLIDEKWYYFDNTGYAVKSQWIQYKGDDYYMTKDGSMATNCYIKSIDKELYYYVNGDGTWVPDTSTPNLDKYKVVI